MREDLFAKITGLTNNSYFDGAHEVRHYLRKHSDLGHIVLEVAKVCRNSELSMSQLYKPIIIQSLARNGILRKPFLSGGNQSSHTAKMQYRLLNILPIILSGNRLRRSTSSPETVD
ncbi:hypothetical protein ZEAMMB73_Zm00001d044897 [Zea mays]|uniref:Uncharacterized protein n=1 Tax=Zea mays TaxID=4577 RepID=A0A1D6NS13_MAIZE|nr:hypothetical protein ZEAMMB73_Zm00001d044897 [Zea mays]